MTADLNLVNPQVLALSQHKVLVLNLSAILIQIHPKHLALFCPVIRTRALYQTTDPAHPQPRLGIASDKIIFTKAKQFFGSTAILSRFLDSIGNPSQPSRRKEEFDSVFLSRGKDKYGQEFLDLITSNSCGPEELQTFFDKVSFVLGSEKLLSATEFLSVLLPNPHTQTLRRVNPHKAQRQTPDTKRTQSFSRIWTFPHDKHRLHVQLLWIQSRVLRHIFTMIHLRKGLYMKGMSGVCLNLSMVRDMSNNNFFILSGMSAW